MKSGGKSSETNDRPNWLQSFFIMCSGANKEVLYQCTTEYNKYSGIGATIFMTALLASFSGGYALYTAFFDSINAPVTWKVVFISGFFGIVWGTVIFNLDRYIVLSLRKERIPTPTEIEKAPNEQKKKELAMERRRLLFNQGLMASPRFLIALVIAFTISKPIELRLFSSRIEKELTRTVQADISKFDEIFNGEIGSLNQQIQDLNLKEQQEKDKVFSSNPIYLETTSTVKGRESQIEEKEKMIIEKEQIIKKNQYLETGTRPVYNRFLDVYETEEYKYWAYNKIARAAIKDKEGLSDEIADFRRELATLSIKKEEMERQFDEKIKDISAQYNKLREPLFAQIEDIKSSYEPRKKNWIEKSQKSSDLLSRMEALSSLSNWFNPVWFASLVITLLFILLETAPVLVKLLTKRGPYDDTMDRLEYEHYIKEQKVISDHNMKINELLQKAEKAAQLEGDIFLKVEKQRLDHELQTNNAILELLAEKQEYLAKEAIENWYQEELRKMKEIPGGKEDSDTSHFFENKLWVMETPNGRNLYLFFGGDENGQELWFRSNGQVQLGRWSYTVDQKGIEIDFGNEPSTQYHFVSSTKEAILLKNSEGEEVKLEKYLGSKN
jgi:hypothetical protein